ncbi:hypothetical protein GCM10025868_14940 [Angustibacter aerolatus]|uniref:Uncharacterized protein n=1 Tax=Angustibacter aerolatus TaxID=1162965 RepID=A0ABQ6JFR8_9ACTN|nr:hypothetical protein GCM10025868_14940 [Angustibacter aerolatus]
MARVDEPTFDDLLPLLRRTFSRHERADRRRLGERLRHRGGAAPAGSASLEPDLERALPALRRTAALLGVEVP